MAFLAAFATVLLWASAFPAIRVSLDGFTPLPLSALRYGIAGAVMGLWLIVKRPALPQLRLALPLLLCAGIGISLYNVLLMAGQQSTPAGVGSLLMSTAPVITALLSVLVFREAFSPWAWLGSAISFSGAATVAYGLPGELTLTGGAALIFGAAICHALYFVLQKPILPEIGASIAAPWLILIGGLCLLPWLPEGLFQLVDASPSIAFAAIFLGLFPAALGYFTWSVAQAHFGAARAANFLYLVPPCAMTIAYFWAGEVPSGATLLGGAIAIGGVILVNTKGRLTPA